MRKNQRDDRGKNQNHRNDDETVGKRQLAGCKRPKPLLGMMPIGGEIQEIVQNITARCANPEGYKSQNSLRNQLHIGIPMRGKQRNKEQEILEPMMKPERLQEF